MIIFDPGFSLTFKNVCGHFIFKLVVLNFSLYCALFINPAHVSLQNKSRPHSRGEYNVYSTFQSHEPEFDYLKSLEIEEKINKIRWLPQQNAAHFLLSTNGKSFFFKWLFDFGFYF